MNQLADTTEASAMIYREDGAAAVVRVLQHERQAGEEYYQLKILKVLEAPGVGRRQWTAGRVFECWRNTRYQYHGGWRLDAISQVTGNYGTRAADVVAFA